MRTHATIGLSFLIAFSLSHPADAADKLSVQTLGARLAAKPDGADAEALAKEVRDWFGKDRAGRNNVLNGANPKVEARNTAWAIEAPEAKDAVIVTSDPRWLWRDYKPGSASTNGK